MARWVCVYLSFLSQVGAAQLCREAAMTVTLGQPPRPRWACFSPVWVAAGVTATLTLLLLSEGSSTPTSKLYSRGGHAAAG